MKQWQFFTSHGVRAQHVWNIVYVLAGWRIDTPFFRFVRTGTLHVGSNVGEGKNVSLVKSSLPCYKILLVRIGISIANKLYHRQHIEYIAPACISFLWVCAF